MNKQAQKADSHCMAKHVNLLVLSLGFVAAPLCGTVVFRTVGRRSNCIFVFVYNSLVSILELGAQLKTLLAGELGAGWRAEGATISFTVAL